MAKTRTDISTAVGISAAFILVAIAIKMGGNVKAFVDLPSILIVIGGTFAATTACYSIPEIFRSQGLMMKTIFYTSDNPAAVAKKLIEVAEEARKNGLLALQSFLNQPGGDKFLKKGLNMIVDGVEPETVESIMKQEVNHMIDRHMRGAAILRKSAEIAPAMGLIGTLIGLVQMLGSLDDPSKIGPAMAVALLTTLYGALLSYVFFSPLASKLERNSHEETITSSLMIKGMVSIGKKENPRRLEMQLNSILPPAKRIRYFD
jgi:chemotaxis protein MotA